MKHKIVSYAIVLVCLLGGLFSAQAASDAEYKKLSKAWTWNADGSQEFHYNMELTIYTHTAMRSAYGETFIVYNPEYQTLKINESYTKQADGTIVKTPDNAFVEVLPRAAANAPAYNHLKEMVIVHTGLELGATIYLDYTLTSKAGYLPALDILEPLQQSSPVKEYNLSISVPEGDDLFYGMNPAQKANVQVKEGMRTVSWRLRNVEARPHVAGLNPLFDGSPLFYASSYDSEADALRSLYAQFETKESMPLLSLAETLTEGKTGEREKLQAILSFVQNDFAHIPLSLAETGYRIRDVEEVIRSAYGTETELLNLLQGLLNAAQIRTEIGVLYPKDAPEDSFGLAAAHLFLKAEADGETYLLNASDPTMDHAGWFAPRARVVDLKSDKPLELPAVSPALHYQYALSWDGDKVVAKTTSTVPPCFVSYLAASDTVPAQTLPLEKAGVYTLIALPDAADGASHAGYASMNTTRPCNLALPYAPDETYTYTLTLPEGCRVATPVGEKMCSNAAGTMQFILTQKGNEVTVTRSLKVNQPLITPRLYADFHALMAAWVNPNYTHLLVR